MGGYQNESCPLCAENRGPVAGGGGGGVRSHRLLDGITEMCCCVKGKIQRSAHTDEYDDYDDYEE